jgi:hypothetical protein
MGVEEPLGARRQSDQHATGAGPSIIRSLGGCSCGFLSLGGCSYGERGAVRF